MYVCVPRRCINYLFCTSRPTDTWWYGAERHMLHGASHPLQWMPHEAAWHGYLSLPQGVGVGEEALDIHHNSHHSHHNETSCVSRQSIRKYRLKIGATISCTTNNNNNSNKTKTITTTTMVSALVEGCLTQHKFPLTVVTQLLLLFLYSNWKKQSNAPQRMLKECWLLP